MFSSDPIVVWQWSQSWGKRWNNCAKPRKFRSSDWFFGLVSCAGTMSATMSATILVSEHVSKATWRKIVNFCSSKQNYDKKLIFGQISYIKCADSKNYRHKIGMSKFMRRMNEQLLKVSVPLVNHLLWGRERRIYNNYKKHVQQAHRSTDGRTFML